MKDVNKFLNSSPAVSVIIPMYNAEKYISECLDSLLAQTFQNFEVVIVDDCSTDNSVAIVESYAPKFNGRLTLAHMEKNTGGCALPRNKGFSLSHGEYVQFVDSDDTLTKTALEEMYSLAKDYDADIVYCERYYMSTGVGEEFVKNVHIADNRTQRPPFVDKPTFETKDLSERLTKALNSRFWVTAWVKFIRRDLIARHKLFFPNCAPSEDDIWTYSLIFYAKKFLRVPNIVYIRRMREDSITGVKKTPQQTINFWLNPVLLGLKELDKLMRRLVFFKRNPQQRYAVLKKFLESRLGLAFRDTEQLSSLEVYETIKENFGKQLSKYDVLIPALCTALYSDRKAHKEETHALRKVIDNFTARIDVKLVPKTDGGDFKIFSVSDDKAKLTKPDWFNKGGIGYVLTSYAGKLNFVAKALVDGKINLNLRGIDVRNSNDKSKRIPYWIDYTKLVVNWKVILDKLTPAWHNKPYRYVLDVKADEEIKIEVEWLPHRSET